MRSLNLRFLKSEKSEIKRLVSGCRVHLVALKGVELSVPSGDLTLRFNDDCLKADILATALHEVPNLELVQPSLILHTMPAGFYRLSNETVYNHFDRVKKQKTGNVPIHRISCHNWLSLAKTLPRWPTTGCVAIAELMRFPVKEIHLHGFNFWAPRAMDIELDDDKYVNYAHHVPAAISWLAQRIYSDPRIIVHGMPISQVERLWRKRFGARFDNRGDLDFVLSISRRRNIRQYLIKLFKDSLSSCISKIGRQEP